MSKCGDLLDFCKVSVFVNGFCFLPVLIVAWRLFGHQLFFPVVFKRSMKENLARIQSRRCKLVVFAVEVAGPWS